MKLVGLAVVVAFGGGCFISHSGRFGGGKSAKQVQRESMMKETPPGLSVDDEWTGEVKTAKIRVWADEDYRAQNVRWRQRFEEGLDYANAVLTAQFGVRLEAEYHAWNRRAPAEASLSQSLAALAKEDSGTGVLLVVGLTSALSLVASGFEQLGVAQTPGKYLVLRGYADVEERRAFDAAFRTLKADERETMYAARRRHKTTAVLLHEIAHNLGAPHLDTADTLMNPRYSTRALSFDDGSREIMLAGLDRHLQRASRRPPPTRTPTPVPDTSGSHPTLVIIIDASGKRIVGGVEVDDTTLDGLLRLSFDDDNATAIVIKASANAPKNVVLDVTNRAKAAGLHRISITRDN